MADSAADRLAVLHGLRLKGFAGPEAVAGLTGLSPQQCVGAVAYAERDGVVLQRQGRMSGWMLTPAGRAEVAKLLAAQLDESGARVAIEDAYQRFLAVNGAFLAA